MLTNLTRRSKTKPVLNYLANKVAHPTSNLRSKNPSSNSHHNFPPSIATRNTSVHEKIVISAQLGVRSGGYSISVLSKASWWLQWRVYRYSLWGSFSKALGRVTCERYQWCWGQLVWCNERQWWFIHPRRLKRTLRLARKKKLQSFHGDHLMLPLEEC